MAYRSHPVGVLIARGQMVQARREILRAYRTHKEQRAAALDLDVHETTLIRWVNRLGIDKQIRQILSAKYLTDADRSTIRRQLDRGVLQRVLAEKYGVSQARISQIGKEA
jgi:Trp operon repressor